MYKIAFNSKRITFKAALDILIKAKKKKLEEVQDMLFDMITLDNIDFFFIIFKTNDIESFDKIDAIIYINKKKKKHN